MGASEGKERILLVDDDTVTLELFKRHLSVEGYHISTASSVEDAIKFLRETAIELVITDYRMPGADGVDLIRFVRENLKGTEVIMITGYPTIEGAVEAVKIGAEEYVTKPVTEEEILSAVRRALNKLYLRRAGHAPPCEYSSGPHGLIGESPAMREVLRAISKAELTMATVLISGECGTGKELVARAIHYGSARASAPFVPVNCGGIPEGLLESELFGHIKGAFTGATESRAGFFQTAERGTIFLDEISDTSLAMQAKLLRVLQDKEVCIVGSMSLPLSQVGRYLELIGEMDR